MTNTIPRVMGVALNLALASMVVLVMPSLAGADAADAKRLVQGMSDYLAAQQTVSFGFDTEYQVVTKERQKISLMSSGTVTLTRPDKVRATRSGGFADVVTNFDGKTLTLLGKNANVYLQAEIPGNVDHLIDELRETYHRPIPGADLLQSNFYGELMPEVIDVKDLGSGVIAGTECNHLAFRTKDVDWEIWIALGERPYPCRYVITSKNVEQAPQYSMQLRDWKSGSEVAGVDYGFTNATNAKKIELKDLTEFNELPKNFTVGGVK